MQRRRQEWAAASLFYTSRTCKPPPSHTTGLKFNFCYVVGERKFFNLLTSASTVSRPTLTYTQALGDEPYKKFLTFWETIWPEHCSSLLTSRYAETGSVSEEESGTWRRSSVPLLNHQVFTPPPSS